MPVNRPHDTGENSINPVRRAICILLASGFLAVQPADTMLNERPEKQDYDYLFKGIEIIKDPNGGKTPKGGGGKEPNIADDPCASGDTCVPV